MRLDAQTADIIIFLKQKGFNIQTPIDIKFVGEEAHVNNFNTTLTVTREDNGKLAYKKHNKPKPDEAAQLFDAISEAIYYGTAVREILRTDTEARNAAKTLVERFKAHRALGPLIQ